MTHPLNEPFYERQYEPDNPKKKLTGQQIVDFGLMSVDEAMADFFEPTTFKCDKCEGEFDIGWMVNLTYYTYGKQKKFKLCGDCHGYETTKGDFASLIGGYCISSPAQDTLNREKPECKHITATSNGLYGGMCCVTCNVPVEWGCGEHWSEVKPECEHDFVAIDTRVCDTCRQYIPKRSEDERKK